MIFYWMIYGGRVLGFSIYWKYLDWWMGGEEGILVFIEVSGIGLYVVI